MSFRACTIALAMLVGGISLLLPPLHVAPEGDGIAWQFSQATAQSAPKAGEISEKEAFDSAKELGSIEAWEAFLNVFPTGFRADLARAYVRKLGSDEKARSTSGGKNKRATSIRQARLATYAAEPGTSPWRTTRYVMDEGNASANAAAVKANGIEFLMYCNANKRVAAVLRETTRGVYPEFDGRIQQGLAANDNFMIMRFSNETEYPVSAAVQGLTGDVTIGTVEQGKVGFRPNGRIVSDMMAEKTITLFAPPFSATLQLKNSRTAICKVVMQCGATVPGCTRSSQKSVRAVKCSSGYKRRKGKCVLIQNCGANAYRGPEGDCYCKKNYEMRSGKCVWKTNKKGFEVAPWNKPGCKTWERQCNQGNSNACLKYEQTCQPN